MTNNERPMKIYLAGRISQGNNWRHEIVGNLREACWHGCSEDDPPQWPLVLPGAVIGGHDYVGPFPVGCDHGCFHTEQGHANLNPDGLYDKKSHYINTKDPKVKSIRQSVVKQCLNAIDRCDLMFAWIQDSNCYGTLVEIGYAIGKGKAVIVATNDDRLLYGELWFAFESSLRVIKYASGPDEAFMKALAYFDRFEYDRWWH